jgi:very-short-patch-repair endonuclease
MIAHETPICASARVCRVSNEDVYKNSDGVLETIYALLREFEPKGGRR